MTQNIYDNEEFFAGYSRLPRSVEGLDGAPEWFAISHVEEWGPTAEQIASRPSLAVERQRPPFLLVAARR
jgi:hypothetical protein